MSANTSNEQTQNLPLDTSFLAFNPSKGQTMSLESRAQSSSTSAITSNEQMPVQASNKLVQNQKGVPTPDLRHSEHTSVRQHHPRCLEKVCVFHVAGQEGRGSCENLSPRLCTEPILELLLRVQSVSSLAPRTSNLYR
jgi:hypothetical protein